jgi:hypothetical protein
MGLPEYLEAISCVRKASARRAQYGPSDALRRSTEESDLLPYYLAGEIEVESGSSPVRRLLFSSRRRLISARSSVNLFGLRSVAACSHNSSQRCLFSRCMKPPSNYPSGSSGIRVTRVRTSHNSKNPVFFSFQRIRSRVGFLHCLQSTRNSKLPRPLSVKEWMIFHESR